MSPWLTVTGTGSWGFGRETGKPKINARGEAVLDHRGQPLPEVELVSYLAGVHEVDEDTANRARLSGSPLLFVTESPPTVVKRDPHGPLSWDDIRLPADGGIYIEEESGSVEVAEDPFALPLDWPCGLCPKKFPSEGARNRHREFHHPETASTL